MLREANNDISQLKVVACNLDNNKKYLAECLTSSMKQKHDI